MLLALLFFLGAIVFIIVSAKKGAAYEKKLTPTMKFIFAAGANTARVADCSCIDIGGNPACKWAKNHMRKLLKSGWDINNTEELRNTIYCLFNGGHNRDCMELIKLYKNDPESEEIKKNFKNSKKNIKKIIEPLATNYENQGILAWDLCRICNVAGWGFLAEYITYEEAIEISVRACELLQENYNSWDHMMESFFLGLYYWNNNSIDTNNRRGWYKSSKKSKDSVYNIPWDTVLSIDDFVPPRTK